MKTEQQPAGQSCEDQATQLARVFHNIYEKLAPDFGYETRKETRDFDPATPNGRLMIAVCKEIIGYHLPKPAGQPTSGKLEQEWTHEKLQGLLQISNEDRYVTDQAFESALDEINAALAAERDSRKAIVGKLSDEYVAVFNKQRDEIQQLREQPIVDALGKLRHLIAMRLAHTAHAVEIIDAALAKVKAEK